MKRLVEWAVNNTPAMNTLMLALLLIVGPVSLLSLRREVFPQFELEIVLITVPYPGASPEEVEDGICQKVEEAVRAIDGIKRLASIAQEGIGYCILEMNAGIDVQKALSEVRSEIDRIPSFPELAEDAEVQQITFREPVIRVAVLGPDRTDIGAELRLREVAEQVRNELLALPTVTQVTVDGSRPYQIDVEISENQLRKYGLTLEGVAELLRRENLELPGGTIRTNTQEILVRGKNEQTVGSEIAKIPLVTRSDGVALSVGDLGYVRDGFEDVAAASYVDGLPALNVSVERSKTEDLLQIVDEVKEYVAQAQMPTGYELKTWYDQSADVRDRMNLLTKNGLQGLVLVFIVLAVFLDIRLAFWVALGIPISVFGACVILLYGDQTLNMLSMFAFLMALGIVVDDAIVIGENIYEHRTRGDGAVEAAISGTLEVLPSVVASVSTTIIAFMPLLFVSGVMGKFIAVMPVAVIAMLVVSLLESTFILPCHLAHSKASGSFTDVAWGQAVRNWFNHPGRASAFGTGVRLLVAPVIIGLAYVANFFLYPVLRLADLFGPINRFATHALETFVENYYLPALRFCLHHIPLVLAGGTFIFLLSLSLWFSGVTPYTTMPDIDSRLIEAKITYPDGTPEAITTAASLRLENAIWEVADQFADAVIIEDEGLIRTLRRSVGQVRDAGAIGPEGRATGSHVAKIDVEMVESSERTVHSEDILNAWREAVGNFPGAETVVFGAPEHGPGGTPIEFRILGSPEQMDEITEVVEVCKAELAKYPGVVDIRDDLTPGKWEYQLKINDRAKSLGITLAELAQTVRSAYYGAEVMRLQRGRHEVKLMVRYPEEERRSADSFENIRVRASNGKTYPLTELADVSVSRGYSEINRIDQLRSVAVLADIREAEGNAQATIAQMKQNFFPNLEAQHPHLRVFWEGQQQQTNESVSSMFRGMIVAMVAMFVLLTVEFRSYFQPAIILAVIPFGVVGAIFGHALMGMNLTLFTVFGLVALTGVVVNDSIVLMDFINLRIAAGDNLQQALVNAGRRRFRPVILTSLTTIAGLTPMLTETSFQAQFLIPLAATLVFGLLVATVMVLLFIPTFYCLYQRLVHGMTLDPLPVEGPPVTVPPLPKPAVIPEKAAAS